MPDNLNIKLEIELLLSRKLKTSFRQRNRCKRCPEKYYGALRNYNINSNNPFDYNALGIGSKM